jgi:hypothetical protein
LKKSNCGAYSHLTEARLFETARPEAPNKPNELKTRVCFEQGLAGYFEEEGVAESNAEVMNADPFPDGLVTTFSPSTVISAISRMARAAKANRVDP